MGNFTSIAEQMETSHAWRVFVGLLVFAAAFLLYTTESLPDRVASHFGGSGAANGFMSRDDYRLFMLAFCVVLPLGLVGLMIAVFRSARGHVRLPNADHWLAPERRRQTMDFLEMQAVKFGSMLVAFLCFVHWRVLVANAMQPPHLSSTPFIAGLAAFVLAIAVWQWRLYVRFRRSK
jgi:uncharacterized membrane protein